MSSSSLPLTSQRSYYGGLGPAIVGLCWPLFAIGTILVGLRIYTYIRMVKNRGGWALIWACVAWVSNDDLTLVLESHTNSL